MVWDTSSTVTMLSLFYVHLPCIYFTVKTSQCKIYAKTSSMQNICRNHDIPFRFVSSVLIDFKLTYYSISSMQLINNVPDKVFV